MPFMKGAIISGAIGILKQSLATLLITVPSSLDLCKKYLILAVGLIGFGDIPQVHADPMLDEFVFGVGGFRALLGVCDSCLVEVAYFAIVVAVALELVARPC